MRQILQRWWYFFSKKFLQLHSNKCNFPFFPWMLLLLSYLEELGHQIELVVMIGPYSRNWATCKWNWVLDDKKTPRNNRKNSMICTPDGAPIKPHFFLIYHHNVSSQKALPQTCEFYVYAAAIENTQRSSNQDMWHTSAIFPLKNQLLHNGFGQI